MKNLNAKKITKMTARFWTKKECAGTLKECRAAGFSVQATEGMTQIFDGKHLVVSWLVGGSGRPNMVRVDLSYFG